jgi:predicted lipid carrier protein YhbT
MKERQGSGHRRKRRRIWILILGSLIGLLVAGIVAYQWAKARRVERFAMAGDSLAKADKLNDAAINYRVALQLDPKNYHALVGAARLATRVDRPEAIELWQKVVGQRKSTIQDREDYAELLLKTNRLALAQKILDPLLKNNPDTKTLQLASRYSSKIGEGAKAIEFARTASKRAPNDDATRFQLADLLAQSTDASEQAEARKILWELAGKSNTYKQVAIEALAAAPQLTFDEQTRLMQELATLTPKAIKDDLLAADLHMQLRPDNSARVYQDLIDHWRNGSTEDLISLARWLNVRQQAEKVLSLFPIERSFEDNQLLLTRLDAMAILQRWNDIDQLLGQREVTLDPAVIESFHARTAQERNATLDAEMHWNHAISLAGTDPYKLKFVANFAEQSRATAAALNAYEQLARFPEQADFAYHGIQRVSQRTGDTATQRTAMAKISARTPEDPNAADQVAYLNLLLGEDVDKNLATAKKLAQQYPNRLAYRVTAALGYLRQHNPAAALAQFNAPVPIDWKQTLPAWRAVYAAALLGTDRNEEAQKITATIPRDRLSPEERALIEENAETKR